MPRMLGPASRVPDRHPAFRLGVEALLAGQPDLTSVGSAASPRDRPRDSLADHLRCEPSERAGWEIAERRVAAAHLPALESIFAVANGYLGMRRNRREGTPAHDPGLTLNGFHETWPIVYPEDAYGLARTGQAVVNVPDGSLIRLFVDNEPFDLATARIRRFERVLDMRTGVLCRDVEWETDRGHRMIVRSRRLASLEHRHLAAMDYEVLALDAPARIAGHRSWASR